MVRLVPMSETEFRTWREDSIERYAQENVQAGHWDPADALELSERAFHELLPDRLSSKNQYLLSIEDEGRGTKVGVIWFGVRDQGLGRSAFVYDFLVFEEFRQLGYGSQALRALEEKAKELGLDTISLQVFGHNRAAIRLYEKAGYVTTHIMMYKSLNAQSGSH